MAEYKYIVTVEAGPEAMDHALLDRLSVVAAYRLETLSERDDYYPAAGMEFDMLDNFEGKYFWDMSDEEFALNPPSRVDFETVAVSPVEPPADGAEVRVLVRLTH